MNEFGKYMPEEAQEEARRMQEKIAHGQATDYNEAENQIENENKEKIIDLEFAKLYAENSFYQKQMDPQQIIDYSSLITDEQFGDYNKIPELNFYKSRGTIAFERREANPGETTITRDSGFQARMEERQYISQTLDKYPFPEFSDLFPENYFKSDMVMGIEVRVDSSKLKDAYSNWIEDIRQKLTDELTTENPNLNDLSRDAVFELFIFKKKLEDFKELRKHTLETIKEVTEKIDNLENEEEMLTKALEFKEKLITSALPQKGAWFRLAQKLAGGNLKQRGFNEEELVYASFIFSPKITNNDFVGKVANIISNIDKHITYDKDDAIFSAENIWEDTILNGISNEFASSQQYQDLSVLEIGGYKAMEAVQKMGGKTSLSDAGHSGYSINYEAGDKDQMIDLSNYKMYGDPHCYDLIMSSRLFDLGSGIEKIAETENSKEETLLGEQEMTLIMSNLLKEGGYMIHYDGYPPKELSEKLGIQNIYITQPGAAIFQYEPQPIKENELKLGNKNIAYNQESKTWERIS